MNRNELAGRVNAELPTRKTSDLDALRLRIVFVLPVLSQMLVCHMQKPLRKLKLRRYIASKWTLRDICPDLTSKAGKQTLLGFEDYSNRDSAGIVKNRTCEAAGEGAEEALQGVLSERVQDKQVA